MLLRSSLFAFLFHIFFSISIVDTHTHTLGMTMDDDDDYATVVKFNERRKNPKQTSRWTYVGWQPMEHKNTKMEYKRTTITIWTNDKYHARTPHTQSLPTKRKTNNQRTNDCYKNNIRWCPGTNKQTWRGMTMAHGHEHGRRRLPSLLVKTRLFLQSPANPDLLYIIIFCHTQLTVTLLLALIFGSKVRSTLRTNWLILGESPSHVLCISFAIPFFCSTTFVQFLFFPHIRNWMNGFVCLSETVWNCHLYVCVCLCKCACLFKIWQSEFVERKQLRKSEFKNLRRSTKKCERKW